VVDSPRGVAADVMLDGIFVGKAPVSHPVAPGGHQVTISEIASKRRSAHDVTVEPGRRLHLGF
jgi:hypothetical protein